MSESDNRRQLAAVLEDELYNYCSSDSLSEISLHEIIKRHGLESNNDSQTRNYEFFFAACRNERVTEGIIQCLLEYFPDAASATNGVGSSPLHYVCDNNSATPNIVKLLIEGAPESVRSVTDKGRMPLHILCRNSSVDEAAAIKIMNSLIEKYPEAVQCADNEGDLPIHLACYASKSPEFCRVLIDAYPGSEQITDAKGVLPLHYACTNGSLATVKYVYHLYPDAIGHATDGGYPIHAAIAGYPQLRGNPAVAVKIVKFLLNCDPDVKLPTYKGASLLYYACRKEYNDSTIESSLQIITAIYNTHPEAIEDSRIARNIYRYHQQVQAIINNELVYARQAKDLRMMTTRDDNGQLPLHRALQNKATLGSIKLLVKGNHGALQSPDSSGALPAHIACQHHNSTDVIQYLLGLDPSTLEAVDRDGNTALHLACRCAKYETIELLLESYDAVSVSRKNTNKNLPIELLWESNAVEDRESIEYTESVFRLLQAHPETLMNNYADGTVSRVGVCSKNEKKRV